MNENSLGRAIVEGAWNPATKELAAGLGEWELDSLLDDGVLKEIPLLSSVIACRKTWAAISDQIFLKKVANFIIGSPKFTKEEIEAFVVDHWHGDSARRLGDTLVLLLDRLDDLDKPKMLAKVFAAFVRKKISRDAFHRLASGIDLSSVQDLKALVGEEVALDQLAEPYPWGLVRSGFARVEMGKEWNTIGSIGAEITELGLLFKKCTLNDF